ncbi:MAG: cell division FtsA domain-containing protein [Sporomusaceae bacterium]|nr:cell division FtsA domain-containing protein [Sporomusaceae bacterium]
METQQHLFALDIGTRSVVGLVGEKTEHNTIQIIACDRQEHNTRAMLDGQIHDVLEVASVIREIKDRLEEKTGPLKSVSVAAAGRALCTIKSSAELDIHTHGILKVEDERALDLTAIQNAQHQIATSGSVPNPSDYYCVGYSVVAYSLDGLFLKSLIGQRGKKAEAEIIATFLPRQVIDSLESAISNVGLEMATLTLEPIAAIHVLIPPTMRHLNLALVDIGAGTSDVALTKDGTVVGYGMVPCAGDEITEAISQKYLLDFNIAEAAKRQLHHKNRKVSFMDVLGCSHKVSTKEITENIAPTVNDLAQAIAKEILSLNTEPPQAVLLVGGGSLTPLLPEALASALAIDQGRVAIRRPEKVDGLETIPEDLQVPDAVTPLGILKLSSSQHLNFISVTLNDMPLRLFNLGSLAVADALLAAGIDIRELSGRPGLGLALKVNGKTQFVPGGQGKPGSITLNGNQVSFDEKLNDHDVLVVKKGVDGKTPTPQLQEVVALPPSMMVTVNNELYTVHPVLKINGKAASTDSRVADRDEIICRPAQTLREVLKLIDFPATKREYTYKVNGSPRTYVVDSSYKINGLPADLSTTVTPSSVVEVILPPEPKLYQVIGLRNDSEEYMTVHFNKKPLSVPSRVWQLKVNGAIAQPDAPATDKAVIEYTSKEKQPMISDVMLAARFSQPTTIRAKKIEILLNGSPAEFTSFVKNQDKVDVIISFADGE